MPTITDDPLWNDLLTKWREALTRAAPENSADASALALRAFAELLTRGQSELAQIAEQFAARAENDGRRAAGAAIKQLAAQFVAAINELNDRDRAALMEQSQTAEIKIKLKKVRAKKSVTGKKGALSEDECQRLKHELPRQSNRETAAIELNKYAVAQLRQIAQAFGVGAAGKKKNEVIALIVNIVLGDSVLAQIVGGKDAAAK
jgi:hypothetical protein